MEAGRLFQNPGSGALLPSHLLCLRTKGSQPWDCPPHPYTSCHTRVPTLPAPRQLQASSRPIPPTAGLAPPTAPRLPPGGCSRLTSRKATPATYDPLPPATIPSLPRAASHRSRLHSLDSSPPPSLALLPAAICLSLHATARVPTAHPSPVWPQMTPSWSLPLPSARGLSSENPRDWPSSGHQSVTSSSFH